VGELAIDTVSNDFERSQASRKQITGVKATSFVHGSVSFFGQGPRLVHFVWVVITLRHPWAELPFGGVPTYY
jgi:hypothetical protein